MIGFQESSAQCVVKGRKTSDIFKFPFQPSVIINHYVSFRLLLDHFENYFQLGVQNYSNVITPQ
jgi:hypothetical protein